MSKLNLSDAGKAHAKRLSSAGGALAGYGLAQGIGATIAVPVTATFAVAALPEIIAGAGIIGGAIGGYKLAKKLVEG